MADFTGKHYILIAEILGKTLELDWSNIGRFIQSLFEDNSNFDSTRFVAEIERIHDKYQENFYFGE